MKATIGRIVHFSFPTPSNSTWSDHDGQSEKVPAIITQVWTDECVNLTVFVDGKEGAIPVTSVPLKTEQNTINRETDQPDGMFFEWPVREK